jgi:succinate-acetate transporter protein
MKAVLYFLSAISALWLLLNLILHVAALLGLAPPLGEHTEQVLFLGVFVLAIPMIFAMNWLSRDFARKDVWKAALRGCPVWMRYLFYFFFGYALLNFVLVTIAAPRGGSDLTPMQGVRGITGHVMAFYSAQSAVLYSAATLWGQPPRCCPEGHPIGPLAKFCDQCGRPIVDPNYGPGSH